MNRLSRLADRLDDSPITRLRGLTLRVMAGEVMLLSLLIFAAFAVSHARRDAIQARHRDAVLEEMTERSRDLPCLAAEGCKR